MAAPWKMFDSIEIVRSPERLTREAFATIGPRTHPVPFGVQRAEELAHEAAILEQEQAAQARVVGEIAPAVTPRPDPDCRHEDGAIVRSVGSTFEGSCTHYLFCRTCDGWYVVTEDAITQTIESRKMTEAEQLRFAAAEDRAQRSEWLEDHQGGAS
jgi:hypothetical protein